MLERPISKAGWTRVRFDQIATQINERVDNPAEAGVEYYVGLEHLDPDSLRIRRWGEPTDVESTKLRFQPGDIIFGKRRVYQRKVAVADFEGICSAHAMVLRAKPGAVLPEFLPFFMQSNLFMERALSISVGSLSPTINWTALAAEEFLLPPIQEQARLVDLFAALSTFTNSLSEAFTKARQCHEALVRHSFRIRKDGSPPSFADLPDGWTLSSLIDIADFLNGMRVPLKSSDRSARSGKYPYYGASGIIDWIDDFIFDEDLVLLSEDGANLVDRSTPIAFEATGKYWVNNHAHVLKPKPPFDNGTLIEYLDHLSLRQFITGSAQPKLNKEAAERISIPVPTDKEIGAISKRLAESRRAVSGCENRLEKAKALQRDMFDRVFDRGEEVA